MLNDQVFYHGSIKKAIVGFGRLFSNIYIDRRQGDSVQGPIIQRLQIPVTYSPKEKWLVRIEQDPTLENHTYTTLPRMAFEITGYSYDASRKVGKMNRISCHADGTSTDMFSPVPYNLEVSLYVLTKTQEDALQIIEQILPTFTPEYTIAVNAVPDMHIIQDIPICLNSISVQDDYEGDFQTRRFVTHTLTFTLKLNLYGAASAHARILHTFANVSGPDLTANFRADGDPLTGEITEAWTENL